MAEIRNAPLLEAIISYAKKMGDGRVLTIDRYVLAVIETLDGKNPEAKIGQSEKNLLEELISRYLPVSEIGIEDVSEKIKNRIKTKNSYMDTVNMSKYLYSAKEKAKGKGLDELPPDILLECILSSQNELTKSFEKSGEAQPAGDADQQQPEAEEEPAEPETAAEETDPKAAIAELTSRVKTLHDDLKKLVFGQDKAVSTFTTGYFQAEMLSMTDKKRTRPRATFLFAGPPGVGKTYLAKSAANLLGLPFKCFDMSEYSDHQSAVEFIGSDAVFQGSKSGNFTEYVHKYPKSIILFDEIEKAHLNIIHLFLQILDSGMIRDSKTDKEIPLSDTILIFTTNAGRALYENSEMSDFSGVSRKVILKAIQKDRNPNTGLPYFPEAILSRFASGNVVMFNNLSAADLRRIAKNEVMNRIEAFESGIHIDVNISEEVFTSLLFAEGGAADARAIKSRAESFFAGEIYELFRLIGAENSGASIEGTERINITADVPKENTEIYSLFYDKEDNNIMLFSDAETAQKCREKCSFVSFRHFAKFEGAKKKLLSGDDINFVLIDLCCGERGGSRYLNVEDVDSEARDFFWYVRNSHNTLPVYILQTEKKLKDEEKFSLLRQGVRGFLDINDPDLITEIGEICESIHRQKSMIKLAKANKLVTFETAQMIEDDKKTADIVLFDFELNVAVDAEDSKNVLSSVSKPKQRFSDVIGAEEAKKELLYFVDYLKNPRKYLSTGVGAPKGVLLYGPPGTGKTMLAKAMACESDVTFIATEGNSFRKTYIGQGKDAVGDLFRVARKYAPSIIFIDEIDAIGRARGMDSGSGADEIDATLTKFLAEMDGFKNDITKPVFVLAATNFDVDAKSGRTLDPALLRRFDRRILVDLPTRDERLRFMDMKFKKNAAFVVSDKMKENLAVRSTGMSLDSLESVIELALRTAIRDGSFKVTDEVIGEAFETFNNGEVKKWNEDQLTRVARHEAGHTLLYYAAGETPSYVTVVARADHGGYMQHADNEGKAIYTKEELLSRIRTSLGGRAAEIVYYGEEDGVSTGASGDLYTATNIAYNMICTYGMDRQFGLAAVNRQTVENGPVAETVIGTVNGILSAELKKAIDIIESHKDAVNALADELIAKNHLTGEEIETLFSAYDIRK
ncbi:MAG: AAA family ATPase [Clostridia bacterium]|nr:AAA family ATPase [Clostridia bacterium]